MKKYMVYSDPIVFNDQMLKDINNAKKSIYLETYIFDKDKLGGCYKEALIKKAKEGVKIKLLFDSFGSSAKKHFFKELIDLGGEVRPFRELLFVAEIIMNHERDHRKLLLIDDHISYVGSANISEKHLSWRECVLRAEGNLAIDLERYFLQTWNSFSKISRKKLKIILHKSYEIVEDFPSILHSPSIRKYIKLINNAKKEILLETAYFVPPRRIRHALYRAVKRGVNVKIVIPKISDVWLIDQIRSLYLGKLSKKGIKIFYYKPKILHAKVMSVDDSGFIVGSSNITHRSFVYSYEINLAGTQPRIVKEIKKHIEESIANSELFLYEKWRKRPFFKRILEKILSITERWA